MSNNTLLLAVLSSFALSGSAIARAILPAAPRDDAAILASMAQRDSAEILMGQVAVERGQHAGVKAYGRTLVSDHTRHLAEVRALAGKLSLSVGVDAQAADMWRDHEEVLAKLRAAEPGDFDGMLTDAAYEGHAAAIIQTRDEDMKVASNASVKGLLSRTLGSLANHLQRAKALRGTVMTVVSTR